MGVAQHDYQQNTINNNKRSRKKIAEKNCTSFCIFRQSLSAIYMSHGIKSTPHSPFRPTKPINASVKAEIKKRGKKGNR